MHRSGTVVPMATPTDRRGRDVDEHALTRFTETLVEGGVHGLFPCSSIGEFPSLTAGQRAAVVRTVVDAADDETPVYAGCCDTSVAGVTEAIEVADEAGADAAVVVVPYYLQTDQPGLASFFEAVADQSTLPVLLYNIPALTGNRLGVETVVDLSDHDAVVGLKDTSGDLSYLHRVIEETTHEFSVFQGATQLASSSLELGADGIIAGPANVFPGELAALYEDHAAGHYEAVARRMRNVVAPLVAATSDVPTASAVKYLVGLGGLDVGEPLPPLSTLTTAERERLAECYEAVTETARVPSTDD